MTDQQFDPMNSITLTDPDGNTATYGYPGFGALPPEQQEQRRKQIERQWRVSRGSDAFEGVLDQGDMAPAESWMEDLGIAGNEFLRNASGGLDAYVAAGASYLPLPGFGALEGMPFLERRDAYRSALDSREERISPELNATSSLAGVLGLGLTFPATSFRGAVGSGATIGGIEGLGNSTGETWGEVGMDTGAGIGVGGLLGGATDLALDKVVGGSMRTAFAKPNGQSARAYEAQTALGIPPSLGTVGNPNAARLENSFTEAPLIASINAALPQRIPGLGRSAVPLVESQETAGEAMLRDFVTDPMRGPMNNPVLNDAQLASELESVAQTGLERNRDYRGQLESDFEQIVPRDTPVDMAGPRAVPDQLIADSRDVGMANRAQSNLDVIDANMANARPIDPALDQQLRQQKSYTEGVLFMARGQLQKLTQQGGDPNQIKALERTVARETQKIAQLDEQIYANLGPQFRAVRDARQGIGKDTQQDGLRGYEAGALYDPVDTALGDAAERVAGQQGRDAWDDMLAKERATYLDDEVLKRYERGLTSENSTKIRGAILRGNWGDLDVLFRALTPDEGLALRADLIDSLGRTSGTQTFSYKTLADNWFNKMPDAAKDRLFQGDPQGRVLMETVAEVARDLEQRGSQRNFSHSASAASVMAGLGAAVALPQKVIPFLVTTLGIERVVVSEALAKAVAGQRTELGQMIRAAVLAGYPAANESEREEDMGPR